MAGYLYGVFSEDSSAPQFDTVEQRDDKVLKNHPLTGESLYVFEVVGSQLRRKGGLAELLGFEGIKGEFFVLEPTTLGENIALVEGSTTFPFMPFVEQCYQVGMALPKVDPQWDIQSN